MSKTYAKLLETAVASVRAIQQKSKSELREWMKSAAFFPPNVSGREGMHLIEEEGYDALNHFGRLWFNQNPSVHARISANAAEDLARTSFGHLLDDKIDVLDRIDIKQD